MSKLYRSSAAPTGALDKLRNERLYGSREEQIATAALHARGCPNPDRAIVTRPRAELRREREMSAHERHLQSAQTAMLVAQRAVRQARLTGRPDSERMALAQTARELRAAYIKLNGGTERRDVEVASSASSWDERK